MYEGRKSFVGSVGAAGGTPRLDGGIGSSDSYVKGVTVNGTRVDTENRRGGDSWY